MNPVKVLDLLDELESKLAALRIELADEIGEDDEEDEDEEDDSEEDDSEIPG